MSLRSILNHPPSPSPLTNDSIHPTSSVTSQTLKQIERMSNQPPVPGRSVPTRSLIINRPKRYLDKVLDPDAFDDLQPDALPPMSEHPYPNAHGYDSSDGLDLDDFAEVWSEPLNQYMVSSRRREQLLNRAFEEWDESQMQDTATKITTWAGNKAERAIQLKQARIERQRQEEAERIRLEQVRIQEEANRIEREQIEEAKKLRKKQLASAARERGREKRRLAKEEAAKLKEEELIQKRAEAALAKAAAIRNQAEALEQTRLAQLREGAEIERARLEQLELEAITNNHRSRVEKPPSNWNAYNEEWDPERTTDHYPQRSEQHWSATSAHHYPHQQQAYEEENYEQDEMINEDGEEIEQVGKARIPSNLANLLNSPHHQHPNLGPQPRSNTRGPRTNSRPAAAAGSTGKRKRGTTDSVSYSPTPSDSSAQPHPSHPSAYLADHPGAYANYPHSHHHSAQSGSFQPGFVTPVQYPYGSSKTDVGTGSNHVSPSSRARHQISEAYHSHRPSSSSSNQPMGTSQHHTRTHTQEPSTEQLQSASFYTQQNDDTTIISAQTTEPVIDPIRRRIEQRTLPAWGYDLPYGTEPYTNLTEALDLSLPIRERMISNPKVLAKKRWEAIEENSKQVWLQISRKDIPKVYKIQQTSNQNKLIYSKRLSALVSREGRRILNRTKASKEVQIKAKRLMRELLVYYRGNEKRERESKRKADKEAIERAKKEDEMREVKRQARKLNFLITQTELYSHFVGNKIKTKEAEESEETAGTSDQPATVSTSTGAIVELPDGLKDVTTDANLAAINFDDDDEANLHAHAARNARLAVDAAKQRAQAFDAAAAQKLAATTDTNTTITKTTDASEPLGEGGDKMVTGIDIDRDDLNFQNPTMAGDIQVKQPKMLMAELKEYQLKGLNWLANLYEQGINGILADEMGLGKTVQSISLMAYLAEVHNIWGPFLVIAPASTLHNWQQEITKFVPALKALPYWGNVKDRAVLRKFWNRKHLRYDREAPFHVVITSYQLVVQDEKYFQTLKWQYMILDEAQAIKSSSSTRWKTLLGFHCRNRLLLTGTPIQNSMTELWALLHFIMPQLFDSHEEFSEWFSKDIENSVDKAGGMNEHQLRRLHMILKPFMLRRIKKNVQNELGDKIEIDVACGLTPRQKLMYSRLRENMSIADLVQKATSLSNDDMAVKRLMNLIMQFRKVCNHPELFERADVTAPLSFAGFGVTPNVARDGDLLDFPYSTRSMIKFTIPKTIYREGGMTSVPGPSSRAGFDTLYLDRLMNIWSTPNLLAAAEEGCSVPSWARLLDFSIGDIQRLAHDPTVKRVPWLLARRAYACQLAKAASLTDSVAADLQTTDILPRSEVLASDILPQIPGTPLLSEIVQSLRANSRMSRPDVQIYSETVVAPPIDFVCRDRSFMVDQDRTRFDPTIRAGLYGMPNESRESVEMCERYYERFSCLPTNGMMGISTIDQLPRSFMEVPQLEKLMLDSGKLAKLDELLKQLKIGGHKVLIYFQMTKMIDLMEEYLSFKHYRYLRLDGNSTISERRDMVMDWQTRPEIFIFLLSTRAGGLGINLTAADTVIFYDCDWNPSNDQQAMDRAHRLGQKRQVTVYRLITSGTIDERILKLARTKKTVQDAVVGSSSGNNPISSTDSAKPNEVVSLLLDEEELEAGLRAQAAKREALKEKQVQNGLRGVKLREERKAALANSHQQASGSWAGDLEEDEEAFGFFANIPNNPNTTVTDEMNGEGHNLIINQKTNNNSNSNSSKKTIKKRKTPIVGNNGNGHNDEIEGGGDLEVGGDGGPTKKKSRAKKKSSINNNNNNNNNVVDGI
ncbi:hypothetical protein CROQUDRAFT_716945 [Cronartium quercuum f. sp. fusiforme G11]|uniref:Chromatin-remodeling ATPase INO80 n=1 Tax=Cronartium quercuum f. sp. fusiforme G11 TaxID=708437 RepID=A0A9P6T9A3_9BASI|nr:hypothetical protein CROQUDRAFT_716945 [Cronartium quercuum f. sp. fusiforme G11]